MNNLLQYIESLGGFHDSVVTRLGWDASEKEVRLEIEDLFSNFESLPEYPGLTPGSLRLIGAGKFSANVTLGEGRLVISEVKASHESAAIVVTIHFWAPTSGQMIATCASVIVESKNGMRWPTIKAGS